MGKGLPGRERLLRIRFRPGLSGCWSPVSAASDYSLKPDSIIMTRVDATCKNCCNDTCYIEDRSMGLAGTNPAVYAHNSRYSADVEIDVKSHSYRPDMMVMYRQAARKTWIQPEFKSHRGMIPSRQCGAPSAECTRYLWKSPGPGVNPCGKP